MFEKPHIQFPRRGRGSLLRCLRAIFVLSALVVVSACAKPSGIEDIIDPYETVNRRTHELNRSLDEAILRPVSMVYVDIVPEPVMIGLSNLNNFLDTPAIVVNNLLQLDLKSAASNSARFAVNGTVGLLGLYDAASEIGLYQQQSDFGETLHVWGVGEGAYIELPVLGGSTERDTVGIVVDALFNPMTLVLEDYWRLSGSGVEALNMLGDRGRFGNTVDSVLYDSADSYAQTRLFYLQSRRYELGMRLEEDDYFDPYEDINGE